MQVGRSKPRREPEEVKVKRDAFPPGSNTSWQAITAGTVLEGSSYR